MKDNNSKSATSAANGKATRSKIGRKNEDVKNFLMNCSRYEAEAIRVIIRAVETETTDIELSFEDATVLNRYLNDGLYKGECNSSEEAMTYRQEKASNLMDAMVTYVETREQQALIIKFLMKFSSNSHTAQQTLNKLICRPKDNMQTSSSNSENNSATAIGTDAHATSQQG